MCVQRAKKKRNKDFVVLITCNVLLLKERKKILTGQNFSTLLLQTINSAVHSQHRVGFFTEKGGGTYILTSCDHSNAFLTVLLHELIGILGGGGDLKNKAFCLSSHNLAPNRDQAANI